VSFIIIEGLVTFEAYLSGFSADDWSAAVGILAHEIHPVDRDATRVWCAFFPLEPTGRLAGQVDSSHTFLYGHRYWPQIKRAVLATAAETPFPPRLAEAIPKVADHASGTPSVDRDQLLGLAIAGLMTLRQCGGAEFGIDHVGIDRLTKVQLPLRAHARSIRQVLRGRRTQRSTGLLGFLRGRTNRFRMTFDENARSGSFDVKAGDTIASSAPAGTTVIGVLAGADRLSPIDPATEGKALTDMGFAQASAVNGAPLIRLASEARPSGDVTFVFI